MSGMPELGSGAKVGTPSSAFSERNERMGKAVMPVTPMSPGMPGIAPVSAMPSSMFGGIFPDVPAKYQNVLNVGISLFQMIFPMKLWNNKGVSGPYSVNVESLDADDVYIVNRQFHSNWETGPGANIRFEADIKTRIATCWMPDDRYWHNRLCLMGVPWMLATVTQLRHHDNSIQSGAEIKMEVACLEKVLKEPQRCYKIMLNGRERDYRMTKPEAEEAIRDLETVNLKVNKDGVVAPARKIGSRFKYTIEEGAVLKYKPEVLEVILRERWGHKFGWTECSYFLDEIQPAVQELIAETKKNMQPAREPFSPEELVQSILSLPEEQLALLRNTIGTGQEAKAPPKALPVEVEETLNKEEKQLTKMKDDELRNILTLLYGVPAEGMKRVDMIKKINSMKKSNPPDEQPGPKGPIDKVR